MFDVIALLKTLGYFGVFGIIFAETGLLFGFFLPGDSLLFATGTLAVLGYFNLWAALIISFLAAVLGEMVGYWVGKKYGHRIFNKTDSILFHQDQVKRSEDFFKKYGGKSIVLARFLPFVRTAVPILAGVGKMDYKVFMFYNVLGGFLWTFSLTLCSFYLVKVIPNAEHLIIPIILGILAISILPPIILLIRNKKERDRMMSLLKKYFKK